MKNQKFALLCLFSLLLAGCQSGLQFGFAAATAVVIQKHPESIKYFKTAASLIESMSHRSRPPSPQDLERALGNLECGPFGAILAQGTWKVVTGMYEKSWESAKTPEQKKALGETLQSISNGMEMAIQMFGDPSYSASRQGLEKTGAKYKRRIAKSDASGWLDEGKLSKNEGQALGVALSPSFSHLHADRVHATPGWTQSQDFKAIAAAMEKDLLEYEKSQRP